MTHQNAAARAAALVRQLLAFSRKQVLQPKTLDLNAIVVNMDKLLRRLIDDHIEMTTLVADNLGKVKADPAQIEQVIMNLVVNARDAMPKGGRIVLETSNVELDSSYAIDHVPTKPGKYVMLAVSNNGIGMDEQTVAHIFEPFFTTKESGRGTGLGLSTVYGIVKQSGGYIWVYSEPGKGSTFKVYLPRVEDAVEPEETKAVSLPHQRGSEVVLLVEDEDAVRDLVRTILAGQGYEVIVAQDPRHAETIASKFPGEIHLLLTDVVMPGASGRELAVKNHGVAPGDSCSIHVRLYGKCGDQRRHVGARLGFPAEAFFPRSVNSKNSRSSKPHADYLSSRYCRYGLAGASWAGVSFGLLIVFNVSTLKRL